MTDVIRSNPRPPTRHPNGSPQLVCAVFNGVLLLQPASHARLCRKNSGQRNAVHLSGCATLDASQFRDSTGLHPFSHVDVLLKIETRVMRMDKLALLPLTLVRSD